MKIRHFNAKRIQNTNIFPHRCYLCEFTLIFECFAIHSFSKKKNKMLSQCHNRELDFKRRLLFCAFFIVISFNRHPISKLDLHIEITHSRKNQSSHFNCHLCLISTELNGLPSLTKKSYLPTVNSVDSLYRSSYFHCLISIKYFICKFHGCIW